MKIDNLQEIILDEMYRIYSTGRSISKRKVLSDLIKRGIINTKIVNRYNTAISGLEEDGKIKVTKNNKDLFEITADTVKMLDEKSKGIKDKSDEFNYTQNMDWTNRVFLAHASEDKNEVRKLYIELKKNGIKPWLDEEDLLPGERWDDKIKEAIKKCSIFLACLSKTSIEKDGYVQRELKIALTHLEEKTPDTIYFIPTLLEEANLPNINVGTSRLQDYQAVKVYTDDGLNKLILQIKKEIKRSQATKIEESSHIKDVVKEKLNKVTDTKPIKKISELFEDISFIAYMKKLIKIEEELNHVKGKLVWRTLPSHSKEHNEEINEYLLKESELMKEQEIIEDEIKINFGDSVFYLIDELKTKYKNRSGI